ncbi:MAG: protein kinase [Myxococcales bacterium]|nr:protein kinase [Myxococcales bacterium]
MVPITETELAPRDTSDTSSGKAEGGASASFRQGDVLDRRWRLDGFLDQGGMGRVWRATDLRLDEPVAIKLMNPKLVATDAARERFMREARAAAKLRGPSVVQILDFNVDPDTRVPYMAMELLRGEDLARRIERGPLSLPRTLAILEDVCSAISRAHRLGLVHRDLKPGNVFLLADEQDGVAKVLDFGVVKLAPDAAGALTGEHTTLGTLSYMSPEQIRNPQRVDHRADLWSLGVIIYECLTGQRPYRAPSLLALTHKICEESPTPASRLIEVPRGFDRWFDRAAHRDVALRFPSANELLEGLRALVTPRASGRAATPEPPPPRAPFEDEVPVQSWASDANQIDIRALKQVVFENAVVSEFLRGPGKHFVAGSKGLGKTLLLTYKRSMLSEQYQAALDGGRKQKHAAVQFIPEGRPYLDLMGDLPSVGQAQVDLITDHGACKRIWAFGFRLAVLSHHPTLATDEDREDLDQLPRRLRAMALGKRAEPTVVVKELLSLSVGQLNRVVDETEGFLERAIRTLHSAMYVFVDKLDQALRKLPRDAWVSMQAGMLEAAWDVMNTNRHVKIYATIREEAFSSYESDIKTNLFGATSTLRYSKRDLEELLEKLTYYYERLPLREFVNVEGLIGTTAEELARAGASRSESAFDYLHRHTLGRPRDFVIIASEISRNRRGLDASLFRQIVQETSASMLASNVFDEMRVFLEVLRDRDQRSRFFALLPYNVLTREEVVDIWCEFHGLDRAYFELHGRDSDDVYHPFRELYDCGLLGIIAREPGSERQLQRFRQPHDAAVGFRRRLPRSRYYLLHPALQALVRRLSGGLQFHAFRQLVVGHGEPWARHAGPTLDVQRELFRGAARDDLETEHEVLTALARLDRLVAMGEPFDHARRQIAASAALVRLTARLERVGWDELYVALLELFPASDDHPARARD